MNKVLNRLMIFAAVAAFALAGCSNQDPVTPTAPVQAVTEDQQAINDAMARLVEMVVTTESTPAAGQDNWKAVEAAMAEYGVTIEAVDKSLRFPLPPALKMVTFGIQAMNAVTAGDTWGVLTSFHDYPGGDSAGFSVSWLTPIEEAGPGHYLCSVYIDRPEPWPDGTIEVLPYTLPIQKAVVRQYQAFAKPEETIIENGYYSDQYVVFNYWYMYRSEIGDRMGQMMQFRLAIIEE